MHQGSKLQTHHAALEDEYVCHFGGLNLFCELLNHATHKEIKTRLFHIGFEDIIDANISGLDQRCTCGEVISFNKHIPNKPVLTPSGNKNCCYLWICCFHPW